MRVARSIRIGLLSALPRMTKSAVLSFSVGYSSPNIFTLCAGIIGIILNAVEAPPIAPSTTRPEIKDAAEKGFKIWVTVVVISCCVIIGIVVAVVACYFAEKKKNKELDTPLPDMLILLKDREHTMSPATIREMTRTVVGYLPGVTERGIYKPRDQAAIESFLAGIRNAAHEKTEAESGETEIIHGARDGGTLPIKKHFRLHFLEHSTDLHISKMEDFYGDRILLAMAPLQKQFVDHWEAIWRQSVGVVVWVGHLAAKRERRMDPYIGMGENEVVNYGPFRITTISARHLEYDVYHVMVRRRGRQGERNVTVIHAANWQQDSVYWSLQKDVDLLTEIHHQHINHIVARLPTMLFQCKYGTAGSATLLATYIGYQMWARCSQVNMYGILQYVRRRRWMAFEQTGDKSFSFLTQVQVAYAVMYAVAKWQETGRISPCENWIKNILVERASVSESSTASVRSQKDAPRVTLPKKG